MFSFRVQSIAVVSGRDSKKMFAPCFSHQQNSASQILKCHMDSFFFVCPSQLRLAAHIFRQKVNDLGWKQGSSQSVSVRYKRPNTQREDVRTGGATNGSVAHPDGQLVHTPISTHTCTCTCIYQYSKYAPVIKCPLCPTSPGKIQP